MGLTDEAIKEIWIEANRKKRRAKDIAAEFHCAPETVYRIKNGHLHYELTLPLFYEDYNKGAM